jgi:hypothetical protein
VLEEKLALVAVLVGLYLTDCIVLLRPTEAVGRIDVPWRWDLAARLMRRVRGKAPRLGSVIHVGFGLTFYPVAGYFPAIINPLTPMTAVFKTAALLPSIRAKSTLRRLPIHRLVGARLVVRSLGPVIAMQAVLLFAAIPYHLFQGGLDRLLIMVLVAFITAATLIAFSYPLVRILKLKRSQYWSLAAQAMICLPLSLNLPRKLALLAGSAVDADQLMARVPATAKWPVVQDFIVVLDYARTGLAEPEAERAGLIVDRLRQELPGE